MYLPLSSLSLTEDSNSENIFKYIFILDDHDYTSPLTQVPVLVVNYGNLQHNCVGDTIVYH